MEKEIKKNPFFAQLLEKQINNEEAIKGGAESGTNPKSTDPYWDRPTMKYPSDSDEASYTTAYDTDSEML